jgi:hypothetical protein
MGFNVATEENDIFKKPVCGKEIEAGTRRADAEPERNGRSGRRG